MPNLRSFTATDQGVNWDLSFEYQKSDGTGPWTLWEGQIPRDLDDLSSDRLHILMELAIEIGISQGIPELGE